MMHQTIDAALAGDICLGEIHQWYLGVCSLRHYKGGIRVYGEAGHPLTTVYPEGNLEAVAEEVNQAVKREHENL